MVKSIYIAGPMAGKADYGRRDFYEAERYLSGRGWIVLNPACLPIGLREHTYMPVCLAMLQAADAVVLLDGWEDSQGAVAEKEFACCQGKRLFFGLDDVPPMDGE